MNEQVSKVLSDFGSYFSEAGAGDLEVSVVNDATKQAIPVKVIDNEDNTYTVELTADLAGTYTTNLNYGGLKVPFNKKTTVSPSVDVSKVQVEGLEQSKCQPIGFFRNILFCLSAFNSFLIKHKEMVMGSDNQRWKGESIGSFMSSLVQDPQFTFPISSFVNGFKIKTFSFSSSSFSLLFSILSENICA
jgi:hypothetical protein